MSCLSNPFDVTIDDLQIILGPHLPPPEETGEEEQNEDDSFYESKNLVDIYGNELKLPVKGKMSHKFRGEDY